MALDFSHMAGCTRCDLATTRRRVVVGSGPRRAALMVVGEAPGATEDEGGAPFIGRSGRLLFSLIEEEVGLTREQCFVTNVVKCRPPANRAPRAGELAACAAWMDEQLRAVAPRVVLVLGATASRALLGLREAMSVVHGRVVILEATPALATYHPAAALRGGPSVVDVIRADLAIVKTLVSA